MPISRPYPPRGRAADVAGWAVARAVRLPVTVAGRHRWHIACWAATLLSSAPALAEVEPTDLADFERHIRPFLAEHCTRCHGEEKQKADFSLHDIDGSVTGGEDTVRWEKVLELLSLGDMPPEDETQPDAADRSRVVGWVSAELRKIGRGQDEGKLALPHQANRLDHDELFSGRHGGPAYSPARLWRKSPQIYSRFASEMRTQISQPLLGVGGRGIQDYASLFADESTIKTMLRNCNLVAENLIAADRGRLNYLFKEGADPGPEEVERGIDTLFQLVFQRRPTDEDRELYVAGLFEKNRSLGGLEIAFRSLVTAMLMSPEFVFRLEVGLGEGLPDGRRMLSPREIAYALSFAFYDKPDGELLKAASEGRLATRDDVAREVRRILELEDERKRYWHYPMYHRWGADYYQHRPRVLRFFQEFFGYTAVADVFKDRARNPDHHANRLRKDADMLVLSVLERDRDVLAELLTTSRYPMDYFNDADRIGRLREQPEDRHNKHLRGQYSEAEWQQILKAGKWPGLGSGHVSAYNIDHDAARAVRRNPGDLVALPGSQRAGMLTHPAWLVAHSGNFDNDPIRRGKWIREHLLADMVPDVPIGVDAKVPEDPQRTLRERMDVVRAEQCWRCHKQMNPLGEAFESYDDFGRHRGQIVLGDADAYFEAKRNYEGQKLRAEQELEEWRGYDAAGRAAKVKQAEEALASLEKPDPGAENYPARLRQYEGDLKRWTGELERWREMDAAAQQQRIAAIERRLSGLVAPVPEAVKPVDASGVLAGTGDPELDGPFRDAVDLAGRLARSERVRQSFVRHAFRYWTGRNETLDDSPTLIAADRAYVEGGGSFKELLVSLLSSDSFLYRK